MKTVYIILYILSGADADVDNVFGVDSDSPSSPSEQLTPRFIALPSFTSSPSCVKSQVIAPTPAENFRSSNSNDDSDYDSDTTPRAMIVEPSNLISMSLDSEATLWVCLCYLYSELSRVTLIVENIYKIIF